MHAQTVTYNSPSGEPIFSITYPEGWSVDFNFDKSDKDQTDTPPPRVVEAMPDDGSKLWLGIWVPPYLSDLRDAPGYLQSLEQYILTDVKEGEPDSKTLNGMPSLIIQGTALKDSQPVEWVMAFFQASESAVGAALYIGVIEDKKRHQQSLDKLINSLRPVR